MTQPSSSDPGKMRSFNEPLCIIVRFMPRYTAYHCFVTVVNALCAEYLLHVCFPVLPASGELQLVVDFRIVAGGSLLLCCIEFVQQHLT